MDGISTNPLSNGPKTTTANLVFAVTSSGMATGGPLVKFALFNEKTAIVADGRSKSGFYTWRLSATQFEHYRETVSRLQAVKENSFSNESGPTDQGSTQFHFYSPERKARSINVYGSIAGEYLFMPLGARMNLPAGLPESVVDAYFDASTAI